MSIEELEQEVKGLFEPQKEEVEKKFDDWSALMKEATMMLSNWDTETGIFYDKDWNANRIVG